MFADGVCCSLSSAAVRDHCVNSVPLGEVTQGPVLRGRRIILLTLCCEGSCFFVAWAMDSSRCGCVVVLFSWWRHHLWHAHGPDACVLCGRWSVIELLRSHAVPLGICAQSKVRVDRICAVLLWTVRELSRGHRCAYVDRICAFLLRGVLEMSLWWCGGVFVVLWTVFQMSPSHRCSCFVVL